MLTLHGIQAESLAGLELSATMLHTATRHRLLHTSPRGTAAALPVMSCLLHPCSCPCSAPTADMPADHAAQNVMGHACSISMASLHAVTWAFQAMPEQFKVALVINFLENVA